MVSANKLACKISQPELHHLRLPATVPVKKGPVKAFVRPHVDISCNFRINLHFILNFVIYFTLIKLKGEFHRKQYCLIMYIIVHAVQMLCTNFKLSF